MKKKFSPHARSSPTDTTLLILLNKPFGVVSQFSGSDRNLSDIISLKNVYPAGRLDKDSEGLLLLTNNGRLQNLITSPKYKVSKTYQVQIEGIASNAQLQALVDGVQLKDGLASAVSAQHIDPPLDLWPRTPPVRFRKTVPTSWIEIVLQEGRNRQIRRMTAAAGIPTLRLLRRRIGMWSIDNLENGHFITTQLSTDKLRCLLR